MPKIPQVRIANHIISDKSKIEYSVVIPVFNEEQNISLLDSEIKSVMDKLLGKYEIIYVNDGSNDSSLEQLKRLKDIKIIEAVKSLDLQGEMHRYILALLRWKGFRIGELEVNHRPRYSGKTKYGYDKAVRGFIDLIYIWFIEKYSQRPLHMFGRLGIGSFFLGVLAEAWSLYTRLFQGLSLNRNGWFFLGFFLILAGIMFFSFGITLDLLMKIYINTSQNEKRYYIKESINTQ